ncbi:MAG: hypothetical protein JNJ65_03030 [Cyclobacteriaceae bacterium]|jgi:hypothetical protein|nr:hypothetical protein [Cyclobacteriaceae bacterium]
MIGVRFVVLMLISGAMFGQDKKLPYYEIPDYPETYTAGAVAARMIDGLGFRYYWATDGLRKEDLAYKPGNDTRTSQQTIEHIYGMSIIILNSTKGISTEGQPATLPFEAMREQTLLNLQGASTTLRTLSDADLNNIKMVFKRADKTTEFPFWNEINGPIADCLWHVGQVVSFRRASGNPFTDKVSVLTGKVIR